MYSVPVAKKETFENSFTKKDYSAQTNQTEKKWSVNIDIFIYLLVCDTFFTAKFR